MPYALSLLIRPAPRSTLFPYTTLFRSGGVAIVVAFLGAVLWLFSVSQGWWYLLALLGAGSVIALVGFLDDRGHIAARSEEHTSELQSRPHLVCRLLLEKKK